MQRIPEAGGPANSIDLRELRKDLAKLHEEQPRLFKMHLEPFLDQLEARYGARVPRSEMQALVKLADAIEAGIGLGVNALVDHPRTRGLCSEMEPLRLHLEAARVANQGNNMRGLDEAGKLLDSLAARYGNSIPIEFSYAITKYLEKYLKNR